MPKLITFALTLLLSAPKDPATREAEQLAKQSIVEYNVGDFDSALADATKAYKLKPLPGLLYDLAQCHRALHHWEKAEFFYRGYLREKPSAPNREAVEGLIAEMHQKQQTDLAGPAAEPPQPVPLDTQVPLVLSGAVETPADVMTPPTTTLHGDVLSVEPMVVGRPERNHHSRVAAATLLGVGIAGLVLTGVSAGELIAYQDYRNGLAASNAGSYRDFSGQVSTAQLFNVLVYVGAALAIGGAGGAVLTW